MGILLEKIKNLSVFLSLVCIILILGLQLYGEKYLDIKWVNSFTNITTAVLASMLVSLYSEYALRKDTKEEILKMLSVKSSISNSGLIEYFDSFKEINIGKFIESSKKVKMYLNFGTTLFNSNVDKLENFLMKKGNELHIYILHENNRFIDGLSEHWGYDNSRYNKQGIIDKIENTKNTLDQLVKRLEKKKKLKGTLKIYQLTRHPVFYSFYVFDDKIIYCPAKIAESKSIVPSAFVVQMTSEKNGIYSKCLQELNSIHEDSNALITYYEN